MPRTSVWTGPRSGDPVVTNRRAPRPARARAEGHADWSGQRVSWPPRPKGWQGRAHTLEGTPVTVAGLVRPCRGASGRAASAGMTD